MYVQYMATTIHKKYIGTEQMSFQCVGQTIHHRYI